jgi:hypothetical protein
MTLLGAFLAALLLGGFIAWVAALIVLWVWVDETDLFNWWKNIVIGCAGTLFLLTMLIYAISNGDNIINWFQSKGKPMTAERGL